ncbi:MAG: hypothetical protein LBQ49_01300 [Rickettsiales bacterium]|jgi:type IV pilus biogenesis protein PilP|nr:hypothetical protein [Rickettsiales bacterium]
MKKIIRLFTVDRGLLKVPLYGGVARSAGVVIVSLFIASAHADEYADVESYDAEPSLFQKIADLEQEKVLMQLEKDKAQLQLDLDRLSAEQARLVREQEGAEARAAEAAAEIEKQKLAIEQERKKLDDQRRRMSEEAAAPSAMNTDQNDDKNAAAAEPDSPADNYVLREIVGSGAQLFATVENVASGKQRKLSVGKTLDDWTVRSISLDDGLEFERGDRTVILGVGAAPQND